MLYSLEQYDSRAFVYFQVCRHTNAFCFPLTSSFTVAVSERVYYKRRKRPAKPTLLTYCCQFN